MTPQIPDTPVTPYDLTSPTRTPDAPTNLQAEFSDGVITITWDNPNDPSITIYEYRAKVVGNTTWRPDWTPIKDSTATTTKVSAHNIGLDVPVIFEIRAYNVIGAGDESILEIIGEKLSPQE